MPEEDLIQKQINLLGRVLGKVLFDLLGIGTQGRVGASIEETKQVLRKELDLDIEEVLNIPAGEVPVFLKEKKQFNEASLEVFADILSGMEERVEEQHEKSKLAERALAIYEFINKTQRTYSLDRQAKIDRIKKSVS